MAMGATLTSTATTAAFAPLTKPPRLKRSVSLPRICKSETFLTRILGNFVIQKARPAHPSAHIHSKPVVYANNGGGRDTYISQNDGGFRPMHKAGYGKGTYFNSLRQYGPSPVPFQNRKKSHTATYAEKQDDFGSSQDHFNPKYRKEMKLVHNYQHMMDQRLSKPKALTQVEESHRTSQKRIRVFKNSSVNEQLEHQRSFYGLNNLTPAKQASVEANPSATLTPKPALAPQDSFDRLNASRSFPQNYAGYPQMMARSINF